MPKETKEPDVATHEDLAACNVEITAALEKYGLEIHIGAPEILLRKRTEIKE